MTETAARRYEAAWAERDAAGRMRLIESFWAEGARMVSPGAVMHGRGELDRAMAALQADRRGRTARIVGEVDVQGQVFRFRAAVDHRDGARQEGFDTDEVDAAGRIAIILTFSRWTF